MLLPYLQNLAGTARWDQGLCTHASVYAHTAAEIEGLVLDTCVHAALALETATDIYKPSLDVVADVSQELDVVASVDVRLDVVAAVSIEVC